MHRCKVAILLLSLISSNSFSAANGTPESILAQDDQLQEDPYAPASAHTIHHVLRKAKIIPSIIEDFKPLCYINLTYPESHVSLGNKILPEDAQDAPIVQVSCPSSFSSQTPQDSASGIELMLDDYLLASSSTENENQATKELGPFTIILTDPDAPSRKNPKWSEICHWIATLSTPTKSAPVSASSVSFELPPYMETGRPMEIIPYKAPGPPPKTGYHRYVFLLFSGDNSNLTVPEDRQHWGMGEQGKGVKDWAKMQNLQVVGANFFLARHKRQ